MEGSPSEQIDHIAAGNMLEVISTLPFLHISIKQSLIRFDRNENLYGLECMRFRRIGSPVEEPKPDVIPHCAGVVSMRTT